MLQTPRVGMKNKFFRHLKAELGAQIPEPLYTREEECSKTPVLHLRDETEQVSITADEAAPVRHFYQSREEGRYTQHT